MDDYSRCRCVILILVDQGRLKASKAPRNVTYTSNCHTHYILNLIITWSVLLMILQDGPDVFLTKKRSWRAKLAPWTRPRHWVRYCRLVFKLYIFVLLKMLFIKSHLKNLQIIIAMIKASLYQLVSIWIVEPQLHNYLDVSQLNISKSVILHQ